MSDYQDIVFSYESGIGHIQLNRPGKLNAITSRMTDELAAAIGFLSRQTGLRGVTVTGSGRGFCVGQDLAEESMANPDLTTFLERHYSPVIQGLQALPAPVVAFVNGVAAGAGVSLALACDITFAVRSASFIQAFSKVGLVPDGGGTYFWPRLVGMQRSMGAALFGERVSAEQAAQWGLIWKCIEDDELDATLKRISGILMSGPTRALAGTKQALYASSHNGLREQLHAEAAIQGQLGRSEDYAVGRAAFLKKQPPVFTGK